MTVYDQCKHRQIGLELMQSSAAESNKYVQLVHMVLQPNLVFRLTECLALNSPIRQSSIKMLICPRRNFSHMLHYMMAAKMCKPPLVIVPPAHLVALTSG